MPAPAPASRAFELYQKAKQFGTWDPQAVVLTEDRRQWPTLAPGQRDGVFRIASRFYEGEASVATQLAPWLEAMDGLDRQMFLTTQLFEEAKHTEFFQRYFAEVLGPVDPEPYLGSELRAILIDDLADIARAIRRSVDGPAEERQRLLVQGVAHYHGVIEGVLAVTGYHGIEEGLAAQGLLPGLCQGFRLIRADEGRHIAFGMDFLREACAANPGHRDIVRAVFDRYIPQLATIIGGSLNREGGLELSEADLLAYGLESYQRRLREIGLDAAA